MWHARDIPSNATRDLMSLGVPSLWRQVCVGPSMACCSALCIQHALCIEHVADEGLVVEQKGLDGSCQGLTGAHEP